MKEKEIIQLEAQNQDQQRQIEALHFVLDQFQKTMTQNQHDRLHDIYQQLNERYLNDMTLDEAQAESLEAILQHLQWILDSHQNQTM